MSIQTHSPGILTRSSVRSSQDIVDFITEELRTRDQRMVALEKKALEAEERRTKEVASAHRISEESAVAHEEECRTKELRMRNEFEKRLGIEVERRLAERKNSLREELAASAASELAERERVMSSAYERAAFEREATCRRREGAAEQRIAVVERGHSEEVKEVEDRCASIELELRQRVARTERAKGEAEARLRETLASSEGTSSKQNEQVDRLVHEVKDLKRETENQSREIARLERVHLEKEAKIAELLRAFTDLEGAFLQQHTDLQQERNGLAQEIATKCQALDSIQSKYEVSLQKLEKKLDKKKRHWAERETSLIDAAESLRRGMMEIKAEKAKAEDRLANESTNAREVISELEITVLRFQEEAKRSKKDLLDTHQTLEKERTGVELQKRDHKYEREQLKESHSRNLAELKKTHQAKLDGFRQEGIDDVRRALVEKNLAQEEKKDAIEKLTYLERQVSRFKLKVTELQNDLEESRKRNDEMDRICRENARLKGIVSALRSEISGSAQSQREEELVGKVDDQTSELEVVHKDRRRFTNLSDQLQRDEQSSQLLGHNKSGRDEGNRSGPKPDQSDCNEFLSSNSASINKSSRDSRSARRQETQSQRQARERIKKKDDRKECGSRIRVRNWNLRDG